MAANEGTMKNPNAVSGAKQGFRTRDIAFIGMFGAIATVLMLFDFPLPFAPSFYRIDFSEVPVLIGTFALGPVAGLLIELIKILLHLVIRGTSTAFVGEIANYVIGAALLLPAGLIYRTKKTKTRAIVGMAAGTACMTIVGSMINAYVLIPTYAVAFNMPLDAIVAMGSAINSAVTSVGTLVLICVVPFNLLKGVIVSVITFLLYKRISPLIHGVKE